MGIIRPDKPYSENDEKKIDSLGESFFAATLRGAVSDSRMILTNKRLYLVGTIYKMDNDGLLHYYYDEQTIHVEDIVKTQIKRVSPQWVWVWAFSFFVLGSIACIFSRVFDSWRLLALGIVPIIISASFVIYYFVKRTTYFIVQYGRERTMGELYTRVKFYSMKHIRRFKQNVDLVSDKGVVISPKSVRRLIENK